MSPKMNTNTTNKNSDINRLQFLIKGFFTGMIGLFILFFSIKYIISFTESSFFGFIGLFSSVYLFKHYNIAMKKFVF